MADSMNITVEDSLSVLKQPISTLEFKPLVDAYVSIIDGFAVHYACKPFLEPLDAVAEYYTIVAHASLSATTK